jgi:hypothetical protein
LTLSQLLAGALFFTGSALAADVTNPAEVENLFVSLNGDDLLLEWDPVTIDATGNLETIDYYEIYRGLTPDFVPDKASASNRIGTSTSESFLDVGVAGDGQFYHYLINAVDLDGNQGVTRPPRIGTTGFTVDALPGCTRTSRTSESRRSIRQRVWRPTSTGTSR